MRTKILRTLQIGLACAALFVGSLLCYQRWAANQAPLRFDIRHLPKEGFEYHDTHGEVPGDPENGVRELKKLYGFIQIYRKRHGGGYPEMMPSIIDDCIRDSGAYGLKKPVEFFDQFRNPDNQYGDDSFRKPNGTVTVQVISKRPDGTNVGEPKPAGTRDLIGMSDLYFHKNIRIYSEGHSTENPVGFYLLLWDDGTVEQVRYDMKRYVQVDQRSWHTVFPGQAGLPDQGVLTYDEYYRKHGWKAGPRGIKGGSGFFSKTYNPPSGS